MASNGLLNKAKKGKCRLCKRVRCTDKHVKPVGEVRHGFATGYVWECKDIEDCERVVNEKLKTFQPGTAKYQEIEKAVLLGRYKDFG